METRRIRITGSGIYGQPTEENPTGEYPIGHEFDTTADLPAAWAGRAVIVGEEPKDAEFITGEGNVDADAIRAEVVDEANKRIAAMMASHKGELDAANARADKAEAELADALGKIKVFDRDGDGNPGGSTTSNGETASADEIKTAVEMLDGKNDTHWTAAGLPAVDAVAELTGKTVTRAAITDAAPDVKRPA